MIIPSSVGYMYPVKSDLAPQCCFPKSEEEVTKDYLGIDALTL